MKAATNIECNIGGIVMRLRGATRA